MPLAILFLIGFALTLLMMEGMLGGFTGALIGLVSSFILRRGPWELMLTKDTLAGAVGFTGAILAPILYELWRGSQPKNPP